MWYLQSFFFFKQKTAYEMRISDWSSDVCSSDLADAAEFDVVINATSLGLRDGDPSPIAIETLQPGALVCEVVMRETDTALLAGARQRACILHEGIHMLHGQLEEMARFLGL